MLPAREEGLHADGLEAGGGNIQLVNPEINTNQSSLDREAGIVRAAAEIRYFVAPKVRFALSESRERGGLCESGECLLVYS